MNHITLRQFAILTYAAIIIYVKRRLWSQKMHMRFWRNNSMKHKVSSAQLPWEMW